MEDNNAIYSYHTIPPDICRFLGLGSGDTLRYEMFGNAVIIKKESAHDVQDLSEMEYYMLAADSMTEWQDDVDDDLLPTWNSHGIV